MHTLTGNDATTLILNVRHSLGEQSGHLFLLDCFRRSLDCVWVEESQPVQWRPDAWKCHWAKNGLPCSDVLDELEAEYDSHGTIRRKFILDTYQDRSATELFIATLAGGTGPDNRGPAKARGILTQP